MTVDRLSNKIHINPRISFISNNIILAIAKVTSRFGAVTFQNINTIQATMRSKLNINSVNPSNITLTITVSPTCAHYFLVSEWDAYLLSDLDPFALSSMDYEIL
jgi:hypothetical protein